MALFDQAPVRSGSRFGKFSSNMFFTRNTAKPKRVRHIEGLNGALICSVNDDPSVVRASSVTSLGFTRPNMPMFELPRRAEKFVPPMGFWNTYGVIHDTERWRKELASLATASGLGVDKDEQRRQNKPPSTTATATDDQHASRSGARYSTRTGRFNEGGGKSRGRTGSKHGTSYSDMLFTVPEHERDMWMLQVLCQLLGTSNLEDVQSWLVSASVTEKEQARAMITSALRGLKESERTENKSQQPVDLNELSNFVEKQKNEEKQVSQKFLKESFNRPASTLQAIQEDHQFDYHLGDNWDNLLNPHQKNSSQQNLTVFERPYHNYNRRSYSSFDTGSTNNKIDVFDENLENQQEDENEEQDDINKQDEDHHRSRSLSVTNASKQSKQHGRSSSSFNQTRHVESLQFDDENDDEHIQNDNVDSRKKLNEHEYDNDEQQRRDLILPPIKTKESLNQDDSAQSRKIRALKNKLSRQEEQSKKQIIELQSKQSRLENAIKLLAKQPAPQGKRQRQMNDDFDVSASNGVFESQKENERHSFSKQHDINSSDHRPNKSYSGVWKPDASTAHRLQGN